MNSNNPKLTLTTVSLGGPPKRSTNTLWNVLNALEIETKRVQNNWIENDDEYLPWGGYPYKVSKIKFDSNGDIISLELTETRR